MYKIIGANQTEYGPVSGDQIRQWITEGRVNAQTLAQAEGETGWKPISQFPEFSASFAATPPFGAGGPPPGAPAPVFADASVAQSKVTGPAIGLMVIGGLVILGAILGIISSAVGGGTPTPTHTGNPDLDRLLLQIQSQTSGVWNIVQEILMFAIGGFLIFSGIKMKKLESYGLAMTANILAMIPCFTSCCCLIGIPIGIWGLVVLNKPEVKGAFK
jgi:GYF domain 2